MKKHQIKKTVRDRKKLTVYLQPKKWVKPMIKGSTRETKNSSNGMKSSKQKFSTIESLKTDKSVEIINSIKFDTGMRHFMSDVYWWTGVNFTGAIGTGIVCSSLIEPYQIMSSLGFMAAGTLGVFGSVYAYNKIDKPVYRQELIKLNSGGWVSIDVPNYSMTKYMTVAGLYGSIGLAISPIISIVGVPAALIAVGVSSMMMAASSLYATRARTLSLLKYSGVAVGALFGLVGLGLGTVTMSIMTGHDYQLLHQVDLYGGLALFSVLQSIETQEAIKRYQDGDPDHLDCSVNMSLNAVNLFVRSLSMLHDLSGSTDSTNQIK